MLRAAPRAMGLASSRIRRTRRTSCAGSGPMTKQGGRTWTGSGLCPETFVNHQAIEQTQLLGRHRVDDVISTQVDWTPRRPPVPITASGIPSGSPINDDNAGTVWKGAVGEGQCANRGSRLLQTGRTSTPSTRLRVIASARWRRGRRQYPPDRQQSRSRCSSTRFIWIT